MFDSMSLHAVRVCVDERKENLLTNHFILVVSIMCNRTFNSIESIKYKDVAPTCVAVYA